MTPSKWRERERTTGACDSFASPPTYRCQQKCYREAFERILSLWTTPREISKPRLKNDLRRAAATPAQKNLKSGANHAHTIPAYVPQILYFHQQYHDPILTEPILSDSRRYRTICFPCRIASASRVVITWFR
jgi:hypothetical protein